MCKLEYHNRVQRWIPASGAAFAVLVAVSVVLGQAQISQAQIAVGGSSPSGAVIPRTGAVNPPTSNVAGQRNSLSGSVPKSHVHVSGSHGGADDHHRHREIQYGAYGYVPYAVAIPYESEADGSDATAEQDNDPDYQGGPTVFDRRGQGADSYVPPVEDGPAPHAQESSEAANEAPQPPTVIVFKDGHKLEVGNYAILGDTLFDLTPGHARRVALAAIDLDATRQQNDDRGVVFQLPATAQGS